MKQVFFLYGVGMTVQLSSAAIIVNPDQDVMTSAFFQGANVVRGYDASEARPVFRVSSNNAFGAGPETVYLDFSSVNLSDVDVAILTMTSVAGGFSADASAESPFLVSAHGVDLNPFFAITDDTNPTGSVAWNDFFENNILPADAAAITSVDSFGSVTFDVTALVQTWEADSSLPRVIAVTGKNDVQVDNGFLHGFENNTENPGATFLTLTSVPEPSSALLLGLATLVGLQRRRR